MVRAFCMNPKVGVRFPGLRSRHFLSQNLWHFHKSTRSCVKNECCCPRRVNISNVNFTLKKKTFSIIPRQWDSTSSWNLSSWKARARLSCALNTMVAYGLATQWTRPFTGMPGIVLIIPKYPGFSTNRVNNHNFILMFRRHSDHPVNNSVTTSCCPDRLPALVPNHERMTLLRDV